MSDQLAGQHHHQQQQQQQPQQIICDNSENRTNRLNFIQKLLKLFCSPIGLVVIVIIYSIMGALIFPLLEQPRDIKNSVAIAKSRDDCLKELWTITEKLNVLYEKNWTMLVHEQLRRFEGSIVAATRNGVSITETDKSTRWSFSEALLYSVTVITTIGHGNLTPKTSGGKVVTIFYALIGVPLMLMCLSSLGGLLAEALQCSYSRFCCTVKKKSLKNTTTTTATTTSSTTCIGGQSNEMNCNVCKYDAINCETKVHNNLEYTAVSEREDSCHLLHNNSPSKLNHSSPCMQVKAHPAIKQYCIQKLDTSPLKHNQLNKLQHQQLIQMQQQQQQQHHHKQQNSPEHYQMTLPHHHNYRTIRRGSPGDACINLDDGSISLPHNITGTTTTAVYFPITTTTTTGNGGGGCSSNLTGPLGNNFTCNPPFIYNNHQQQQQPLVKYHTIQLQHSTNNYDPHLQTATVHGIRRGKYIPKPMPPEINMLLAESDLSFNKHDDQHHDPNTNNPVSGGTVDIMEDEEENEHNRIGCQHGTPSRIPLISSSSSQLTNSNRIDIEQENRSSSTINTNNRNATILCSQVVCGSGGDDDDDDYDDDDGGGDGGTESGIDNNQQSVENQRGGRQQQQRQQRQQPQVPITIVFCILTGYIGLGTIIFAFWENWSFIDGAYFCFVTLSTIGYGDFLPQNTIQGPDIQLLACCVYLLLGLVLVAMSFSIMETQLMWKCKRIAVRLKLTKD